MLNKRGAIVANVLLFVGFLILFVYAGFVIVSFDNSFDKKNKELQEFSDEFYIQKEYVKKIFEIMVDEAISKSRVSEHGGFEDSFKGNLIQEASKRRNTDVQTNLFAKIINCTFSSDVNCGFSISKDGDVYVVSLKDVFVRVKSKVGQSEAKLVFDLEREILTSIS